MDAVDRDRVVERVREATDIVAVIGAYVDLRQAGRDFKARCPFHQEKSPSFTVSAEKQVFHCFGCNAGGDVFSFVMKHDGLTFPEALQMLARRAGIELPEARTETGPDKAQLMAAMREAVRYYRGQLRGPAGRAALDYLRERKLPGKILDAFYTGYAPASGHALLDHLRPSFSREVLIEAGLIGQRDEGRLHDRFRDRVVLPILGVSGEPLGFGARALRPDVEPKYLNSPETRLYRKRGELFGLPQARQAIRREGSVLVVEGYFDVLSLASAGIYHAVAPCGTAWTEGHTRRLLQLRYGQRIAFLFDGDAAGQTAAWRSLSSTLPHHADVRLILLPPGKDPDDLVRAGDLETLKGCLASPYSPVAYGIEVLGREGITGSQLMERIAEMLASVGDAIAREMMLDEAAERSRLPVNVLRREVERRRQRVAPGARAADDVDGDARPPLRLSPLEEATLRMAQSQPRTAAELRRAAEGVAGIGIGVRNVLEWVAGEHGKGGGPNAAELLHRVEGELGGKVHAGFLLDESAPEPDEQYCRDLLRRLREQVLASELEALGFEIRVMDGRSPTGGSADPAAGNRGADGETGGIGEERRDRLMRLLARKQALARELGGLREADHPRPE
jgi:DNA primase